MTTRRDLLHLNQVQEFGTWLKKRSWFEVPKIGAYEVLRMRHANNRLPLIVYRRDSGEHATVTDSAIRLVRAFIAERRSAENKET